jgi:3-carboxy-cis,cis-muconate cycloisomerase
LVLQIRRAHPLLDTDLDRLERALARLAERHTATVMVGRTLLQQAVPITFGLKAAGWLSATLRVRRRFAEAAERVRVLQFGGAAGSLSSLGGRGLDVAATLARELGLDLPDLPWHGHRDRLVDLAGALGLVAGVLGKFGRDLSLLMQNEVAEVREPLEAGKGGSSTMPQKQPSPAPSPRRRHPRARAGRDAVRGDAAEHERGSGGTRNGTIPEVFGLVAGAARAMAETFESLRSMRRGCARISMNGRPRHGRGRCSPGEVNRAAEEGVDRGSGPPPARHGQSC